MNLRYVNYEKKQISGVRKRKIEEVEEIGKITKCSSNTKMDVFIEKNVVKNVVDFEEKDMLTHTLFL